MMAKHCEANPEDKGLKNGTRSDLNPTEETESLTAARDHGSQIEKHQFHKHYYFGGYELEQMTYERAMLMTDLTLEEFYIMHMKLKPVPIFTARCTVNTTVTTNVLNYPVHTDFMFEYEENFSETLTFNSATQVSRVATQADRNFNNSYPPNFAMETESRNHGTYTEKNQFHKQYYFGESGPAFKRMSHNCINVNWNEFHMHTLCLERKPIPIYTASYTQKYTLCAHYHADAEYECEIIPLSTDDPFHTYFMFEYEENMVTFPIPDRDVTTAHAYFMSKDNETMIVTNCNSTLSHCTSGDDKTVAAKNSSKNNCTNNSEAIIAQLELTNNHTLAYLDDSTRIYDRNSSKAHHNNSINCQDNETSATVTSVTLSDNTASNSTCTPEKNEGIVAKVSSKNNCSESGDKTVSWCVYTFNDHSMDTTQMSAHVFANSSTFSNSTTRAGSSSSNSRSGYSSYGAIDSAGAAAVPFLDYDVLKIIIVVIIALLLLFLIIYLIKKYFLKPRPKRQDPKKFVFAATL